MFANKVFRRTLSSIREYQEIPTIPLHKIMYTFITKKNKTKIDKAVERHFEAYGPMFRVSSPWEPDRLFIRKPEHYAQVLAAEGAWPENTNFDFLVSYRGNFRRDLFPESGGLIGSHGEQWLEFRSEVRVRSLILMG